MAHDFSTEQLERMPDAEARLLLATAKYNFSHDQVSALNDLVKLVSDWNLVTETAMRKFSAPYLREALSRCEPRLIPVNVMQRLQARENETKLWALKISAAQIAFHKTCIQPKDVRHAYVKGLAFSLQFNGNFAHRFCRDIDVLVDAESVKQIVEDAFDAGYGVLLGHRPIKFAKTRDELEIVTKFHGDIGLISPEGVLIEVHRRLDKQSVVFDTNTALEITEPVDIFGTTIRTLEPSLHFTYVCYHHARHFWSHLHWLADIDLALRSSKFDRLRAQTTAQSIGLSPTVVASMRFSELLAKPTLWTETDKDKGLVAEFLNACLINLTGGAELEAELRKGSFQHDFISESQVDQRRVRGSKLDYWRTKLRPMRGQYGRRPVPSAFFWIYRVQRSLALFSRAISKSVFEWMGKDKNRNS